MTKPVTRKMAVQCLIHTFRAYGRVEAIGGYYIICTICGKPLYVWDDIQFDHIHADVFDGPHEYQNLRPVHAECHKKKTARDIKDNAKIKRLRGETKNKPGRRIASKPFPKRTKPYVWPKREMRS